MPYCFIWLLLLFSSILRLGGGQGDAEEVKKHIFFQNLDFKELYDKKVTLELYLSICGL